DEARPTMAEMATALGLAMPAPKRGAAAAVGMAPAADAVAPASAQETDTLVLPSALGAPTVVLARGQLAEPALPSTAELLGAGIQDIADTLAGDTVKLNDVLRMVLETIYRALDCERVVFCLREANGQRLVGRFGLGVQAPTLAPLFQIALKPVAGEPPSLFTAVCLKGEDSLVPDVHHAAIAKLVPAWHQQHVPAHTLLLLPLVLRNAPLALIYADRLQPFALGDRERALLRTLRNQAVMAFRQAGH
ncbi:MAG: serine/threonine protein kinase, partial [Burkholderiales bacterium PBB5]